MIIKTRNQLEKYNQSMTWSFPCIPPWIVLVNAASLVLNIQRVAPTMTGIFTFHTHIVALNLVATSFGSLQLDALKDIFTNTSIDIEKLKVKQYPKCFYPSLVFSSRKGEQQSSVRKLLNLQNVVGWWKKKLIGKYSTRKTLQTTILLLKILLMTTSLQSQWQMLKRLGLLPVSKLGNNTKISICNSDIIFRPYYNCFYQSDEKLVEMVQKSDYNLVKPSSADYNFSSPYLSAGQWGQVRWNMKLIIGLCCHYWLCCIILLGAGKVPGLSCVQGVTGRWILCWSWGRWFCLWFQYPLFWD